MVPKKGSVHVAYIDVSCPCPHGLVEGELSCQLNGKGGHRDRCWAPRLQLIEFSSINMPHFNI